MHQEVRHSMRDIFHPLPADLKLPQREDEDAPTECGPFLVLLGLHVESHATVETHPRAGAREALERLRPGLLRERARAADALGRTDTGGA